MKNQINDKLKIKRELSNARVKKYRKKKCTESEQLNYSMQDDPSEEMQNKQVKENNAKRKRVTPIFIIIIIIIIINETAYSQLHGFMFD